MNYLLALMQAVSFATSSGSAQQLADAGAAQQAVGIEQSEYTYWQHQVTQAASAVSKAAAAVAANPTNTGDQAALTSAQTKFQSIEAKQQMNTQLADSAEQITTNQVQTDSQNSQQHIQLEAVVNQIAQALQSDLGRG